MHFLPVTVPAELQNLVLQTWYALYNFIQKYCIGIGKLDDFYELLVRACKKTTKGRTGIHTNMQKAF